SRDEPAVPPLLLLHQHDVPVGALLDRPDGVVPQLPELRRFREQVLHRLVGRGPVGEAGAQFGPDPPRQRDVGAGHRAAGFVGSHVSLALKKRGDGVVGIDNFNHYYDPSLKKARRSMLAEHGIFVVAGDINDGKLLAKLFDVVGFTHVMHLAAQAGVRYAMENPNSYIHSNIAGLVTLLEICKLAETQPAVVWASSSSVYGLNEKSPFSESDRTDQPASLYAATKKAGEEITHTYNHIYGLSITGLRFFTVYGPWGRPDMAYFSFTKNILQGKPITVYRGKNRVDLARDFTYIDDVVKGCLGSLDTAGRSTGSGGKKTGPAPYRIFNLGNTSPVTVPTLVSILERHLKVKAKKKVVEINGKNPKLGWGGRRKKGWVGLGDGLGWVGLVLMRWRVIMTWRVGFYFCWVNIRLIRQFCLPHQHLTDFINGVGRRLTASD
ncbi:unnamed protein product, partial [Linum tenue]